MGVQELYLDPTDGDSSDMIFSTWRPGSDYDKYYRYRGEMKIKYTDNDNIWMINVLPLEQYVWGIGETSGTYTDIDEYYKTIVVIFRTYGKWKIENGTTTLPYGFRLYSDARSQVYSGYDHENDRILGFAKTTRGVIATYNGETALTPYSSWSDGHTRSFQERWGSTNYPWCQSVPDPYGVDSSRSTEQLVADGNHMVGLIANGAVHMARHHSDEFKTYKDIMNYYYKGIDLTAKY